MCGKQLADTRCGLMILLLLSYVTEQVTARTGTRNRYDHYLLTCANWTVFFPLVFISLSPLPNSFKLPFTSSISTKTLAHSNFLQPIQVQLQKLVVRTPLPSVFLHHLGLQLSHSPACPRHQHPPHCNYCQSR